MAWFPEALSNARRWRCRTQPPCDSSSTLMNPVILLPLLHIWRAYLQKRKTRWKSWSLQAQRTCYVPGAPRVGCAKLVFGKWLILLHNPSDKSIQAMSVPLRDGDME
ncbi:hypothetical protein ZWY2020_003057 [Hordeum vulgare]|nr:hypothetical protein ZWY2020_003057 [Hordeum vulgare]